MTVPGWFFSVLMWSALAGVGAIALYLVVMLVLEWRNRDLW